MNVVATSRGDVPYLDEGTGEVVVLLHGWPGGPYVWRRLWPLLATRFRVLVPELSQEDVRHQATAVRELLRSLGVSRFAVIGHSHGGGVAQLVALEEADVGALVLIDSVAFDQAPPSDLDPAAFVRRGTVEVDSLSDEDLAAYTVVHGPPPLVPDLTAHVPAMAEWGFPVLLLWGEDDPFVPVEAAERLGDALPGSTLGVVPDSGHLLLEDAFDGIGSMIHEWLRARYLGAPHGHEGVVMLQLERRPGWVDALADDGDDDEPVLPDPADQEVGPNR